MEDGLIHIIMQVFYSYYDDDDRDHGDDDVERDSDVCDDDYDEADYINDDDQNNGSIDEGDCGDDGVDDCNQKYTVYDN